MRISVYFLMSSLVMMYNCGIKSMILEENENALQELFEASKKGDVAALKRIIDGGEDINARDSFSNTPLFIASVNRQREALTYLLDCGADIRALNKSFTNIVDTDFIQSDSSLREHIKKIMCDQYGWNSIHIAVWWKDPELGNFAHGKLQEVNGVDCDGNTPLHLAVLRRDAKIIQILLDSGAEPLAGGRGDEKTAFDLAVDLGRSDLQAIILNEKKCH